MSDRWTVREATKEALAEAMERDPNVFLMGEEVGVYGGAYKVTQGLLERFGPERVIDTPISEHAFSGLAVGAAMMGLRPIVEFMSFNFSMQAMDHIINSAAKLHYMSGGTINCPVVFRGPNGMATQLAAQHSQCFASWYAHCPGLKVVAPSDAQSAKDLLIAAIFDPNPTIVLENEVLYGFSFPKTPTTEPCLLEKAVVRRKGADVTLVSFSLMVNRCLEAAENLARDYDIHAEVVDLCTLRPMDTRTVLESVRKTHRLVTIEGGWAVCGIGAEVIAVVNEMGFDDLDAPPIRISGADIPMPYARELEELSVPSISEIVAAARAVCHR